MKLKRLLAAALAGVMAITSSVVTSVTASAAADPVLPDVEYGTVKYEKTGEHTFALGDDGSVNASIQQIAVAACGGNIVFEEDDVVLISVTTDAADISTWKAAFNGFSTSWSGWKGVGSAEGVLTCSATVKEIMTANSITDIADFGGLIYQVWNVPEGATVKYSLLLAEAAETTEEESDIPDPVLPDVEYGTVKYEKTGEHTFALGDDGSVNASIQQIAVAACGGNIVFEEDDVVLISVTTDATDVSTWKAAFNGFSTSWSGWKGVGSAEGVLTCSATVKEIMTANSITDIADFGGLIYQVWNVPEGATVKYSLLLAEAAEAGEEDEPSEDEEVLETGTYTDGKWAELSAEELAAAGTLNTITTVDDKYVTTANTLSVQYSSTEKKLRIYKLYNEADLTDKSSGSIVVKKGNVGLKLTTECVYTTLADGQTAPEGCYYIAWVINKVDDPTVFSYSDITLA